MHFEYKIGQRWLRKESDRLSVLDITNNNRIEGKVLYDNNRFQIGKIWCPNTVIPTKANWHSCKDIDYFLLRNQEAPQEI